jgi:hypothetical protein
VESGYFATRTIFAVTACRVVVPARGMRHKDQLPMSSSYVIVLSDAEEAVLSARAQSGRGAYRDRLRAQIVLAAAAGRAEAVALACALPAETGVPLLRWSCPELARELAARRQLAASASTMRTLA